MSYAGRIPFGNAARIAFGNARNATYATNATGLRLQEIMFSSVTREKGCE